MKTWQIILLIALGLYLLNRNKQPTLAATGLPAGTLGNWLTNAGGTNDPAVQDLIATFGL